jgi:hypothetical protein
MVARCANGAVRARLWVVETTDDTTSAGSVKGNALLSKYLESRCPATTFGKMSSMAKHLFECHDVTVLTEVTPLCLLVALEFCWHAVTLGKKPSTASHLVVCHDE